MKINIAVDGPAGSGKGTVAKLVAKRLGYLYVDTGVMYRVLTYILIKKKVSLNEDEKIKELLIKEYDYEIEEDKVIYDGIDISEDIRSDEVNKSVSIVAGKPYVREFLINIQKNIASEKGVVMDGRDITSVVLKDAELKIYLEASFEERVKRRYLQEKGKGKETSLQRVRELMKDRDYRDMIINKTLVKGEDVIVVDTTYTEVEEVVNKVVELAKGVIKNG